jgi:hypothetical protein
MSDLTAPEFFTRFRDDQEIGRDITDTKLEVYYDNGHAVGRVVQDRGSTRSHAELLHGEHADAARDWCRRQRDDAAARVR